MKGSINVHKREMFVIDVSLFLLGHVIVAVDNNRKHKSDAARSCWLFSFRYAIPLSLIWILYSAKMVYISQGKFTCNTDWNC